LFRKGQSTRRWRLPNQRCDLGKNIVLVLLEKHTDILVVVLVPRSAWAGNCTFGGPIQPIPVFELHRWARIIDFLAEFESARQRGWHRSFAQLVYRNCDAFGIAWKSDG